MDSDIILRTVVPILFLIFLGYVSRKFGLLKHGDERVFSAYVYYFALPALFIVDLADVEFTFERLLFIFAGQAPILLAVAIYIFLYKVIKFSKETLYLLIISTIFGSLAFFGIPFVMLAFPNEVKLATLSVASISIIAVPVSITILELHRMEKSSISESVRHVAKKLSRNPLIISIILGFVLSLLKIKIPSPMAITLRMLGATTAAVAIFMLGVFFYGRKYAKIAAGFKLSLLRAMVLPTLALLTTLWLNLPSVERSIILVMHGSPVAVSNVILSERYNFYKETVASLILISSISAGVYLNLWLLLLGY
ncbi:MAG: AEC family transporter [Candidatus Bathyarchaeia archaeon]